MSSLISFSNILKIDLEDQNSKHDATNSNVSQNLFEKIENSLCKKTVSLSKNLHTSIMMCSYPFQYRRYNVSPNEQKKRTDLNFIYRITSSKSLTSHILPSIYDDSNNSIGSKLYADQTIYDTSLEISPTVASSLYVSILKKRSEEESFVNKKKFRLSNDLDDVPPEHYAASKNKECIVRQENIIQLLDLDQKDFTRLNEIENCYEEIRTDEACEKVAKETESLYSSIELLSIQKPLSKINYSTPLPTSQKLPPLPSLDQLKHHIKQQKYLVRKRPKSCKYLSFLKNQPSFHQNAQQYVLNII